LASGKFNTQTKI
jgi:hypothetical protein